MHGFFPVVIWLSWEAITHMLWNSEQPHLDSFGQIIPESKMPIVRLLWVQTIVLLHEIIVCLVLLGVLEVATLWTFPVEGSTHAHMSAFVVSRPPDEKNLLSETLVVGCPCVPNDTTAPTIKVRGRFLYGYNTTSRSVLRHEKLKKGEAYHAQT